MADPDPLLGSVVSDRYRIDSLLGEGSMGRVYQAQHVVLKNRLAVKVLQPELSANEEIVRRFEREALAAGNLSHPNIVRATDFGRTPDGRLFLVLEYVAGRSLFTVLSSDKPLVPHRACHIARQILSALIHAHSKGIVHRDLKPENVVLIDRPENGEQDIVKILDFGIAKVIAPELATGDPLTQLGLVYGTPEYLSPEQALGRAVDARADLYALGVILYEMIVGRRPFDAAEQVVVLLAHANEPPPPPSQFGAIAPALETYVLRLLAKSPDDRYADAKTALDELDRVVRTLPRPSPRPKVDVRAPTVAVTADEVTRATAGRLARAVPMARAAGERLVALARKDPRGTIATVVGVLCLLVLLLVLAQPSGDEPSTAVAPAARPASSASAPARPASRNPEAALHVAQANAWARSRDLAKAIRECREALRLDRSLANDPAILDHLVDALSSPRVYAEAEDLLRNVVGEAAVPALQAAAVEDQRMKVRQRARALLEEEGGSHPDWVAASFAIEDARTCEERSAAIARARDLGDERLAHPLRRRRRDRRGMDRACDRAELDAAIAMMGG